MAASTSDKFKKVGSSTVTSLAAPGKALGATTITVGSTTNYPTDTGLVIAIRVVDSNGELVAGTYTEWGATVTSGTSLSINATPVYGSDQVYSAGSTTQVYLPVSSKAQNDLVDGILVSHNQDGTLKTNSVTTAAITDSNVTTAKIADSNVTTAKIADGAVTNAKLDTTAGEIGGASVAFTPVFILVGGASSVGNAVRTGGYIKTGKRIKFWAKFVLGTTTNFSGLTGVQVNFPIAASAVEPTPRIIGNVFMSGYNLGVLVADLTTTGASCYTVTSSGTYIAPSGITGTAPLVWANTNYIIVNGEYETA